MRVVFTFLLASVVACGGEVRNTAPAATESSASAIAPEARTEARAARTINGLTTKDFVGAREWFDSTMLAQLSADRLQNVWSQITSTLGAFKSSALREKTTIDGHPAVVFELTFEHGHALARVVFSDAGLVSGLFIQPG